MRQGHVRFRILLVKPLRRRFIGHHRLLLIPEILLIQLRKCLLVASRPPEVTLPRMMRYDTLEHARGLLGIRLPVHLERFDQGVGSVVGLVELGLLDLGSFFEGLACFLACMMDWFSLITLARGGMTVDDDICSPFFCIRNALATLARQPSISEHVMKQ